MNFKVSVIIPVYNTEAYIKKAVESALMQPEVEEVLVINDGSTDGTSKILQILSEGSTRVKILYHVNRKNLGRSASRNLGIKAATSEFIAFLDADDYYLKDRFVNDKIIFEEYSNIDGIYNAIGVHFYRAPKNQEEVARLHLTTLKERVSPKELFWYKSPKGKGGSFHGNGLTLKREIFEKVGCFNEELEVAEDSELWIKMSLRAIMVPGILDRPVSIRGVHERNVFNRTEENFYNKNYFLMYDSLLNWAISQNLNSEVVEFFKGQKLAFRNHLMQIDSRKIPSRDVNYFFLKKFLKDKEWSVGFNYLLFTFVYKPIGKGYFLRRLYLRSSENS